VRAVLLLLLIALALGVLLVGIAVMIKEPQGIVAIGTLGLVAVILWFGFALVFGRDDDSGEEPKQPETAGESLARPAD
jgi:hypothetical protein